MRTSDAISVIREHARKLFLDRERLQIWRQTWPRLEFGVCGSGLHA